MASEFPEYDAWKAAPTPENLAPLMDKLDPTLVSEVQRYPGPKHILYTQAKQLAIKAVHTYDPARGAALRTWVTTNLQPLTRYSAHLKSVRVPEEAAQQSAHLHRLTLEYQDRTGNTPTDEQLADEAGMPVAKLQRIRGQVRPQMSESQLTSRMDDEGDSMPAVSTTNSVDAAQEGVYQGLDPREQLIFDWKTGAHGKEQLENQEIASRLQISAPAITQITHRIANRIKEVSRGI